MILGVALDALSDQMNKFRNNNGITCLSETNNDLLMWAHYGGKYKGFCLEFDTSFEPFNNARKVNYLEVIHQIDPVPLIRDNDAEQFLNLLCSKSSSWGYEKEWRILHTNAGTPYVYPTEALTGVFFGPDIEPECLEILALILKGQNGSVKLYRGKRSTEIFKVEYEEVNYTPHLEAKKLGLL